MENRVYRKSISVDEAKKSEIYDQLAILDVGKVVFVVDDFDIPVARFLFETNEAIKMPSIKLPYLPSFIMERYEDVFYSHTEYKHDNHNEYLTYHIFLWKVEDNIYELTLNTFLGRSKSKMELRGH